MKAGGYFNRKLQEKLLNLFREYPGCTEELIDDVFSLIQDPKERPIHSIVRWRINKTKIFKNRGFNVDVNEFRKRNSKILQYLNIRDVQIALEKLSVEQIMNS